MLIYRTASAGVRLGQKAPFAFWANHMRDDAARRVCKGVTYPFARGEATLCTTIAQSIFLIVSCFAIWYIYLVLFVVMPDNVTLCKVGHDRTKGVIVMSATTLPLDVGLTALTEYVSRCDNRFSSFPDVFSIGDYVVCSREYPFLPFPPDNTRYSFDFGKVFSDFDSARDFVNSYVIGFEVEEWNIIEHYDVEIWHIVSDVDSVLYNPAIFGPDSPVFTVVCNFNTRSTLDEPIKVYKFASLDDAIVFTNLLCNFGYSHFVIDRHDYCNGYLVGLKTIGFRGSDKLIVLAGE